MKSILLFLIVLTMGSFAQIASYDFEESGAPSGIADDLGTPDYDYTGIVLGGSQSAHLALSEDESFIITLPAAYDAVYMRFRIQFSNAPPPVTEIFCRFRNDADVQMSVYIYTSDRWRLFHGGTGVYKVAAGLADATTYYMWLEYVKGTGSDGVAHLYYSTDKTKPATPDIDITTGTATLAIDKIRIENASVSGTSLTIDDITIDDEALGDFVEPVAEAAANHYPQYPIYPKF